MKIKSIAAICKKNKNIAIFERYSDDGDILTQYIGDGSAVYPVIGLPPLDAESLLTIFDVPEKDRDNYFVKTLGIPAGISFEDTDATERQVEREGISIIYSGRTLKPIHTTRGLVFIESRYLAPVADVLDVLELYERRTTDGAPYIVAKAGFLLQAVIMPYDVINQQFVESLQALTRECEFALSEKERREREARDHFTATEPEQFALNVDPKARWRTMPKMTVRVILKSGVEFSIKCDKFTLTRNGFQQVTGYNIEGITENQPVYLDFEQVAAVVRVFSDEKEVAHDEQGASIL
jgi:hypothetical protein